MAGKELSAVLTKKKVIIKKLLMFIYSTLRLLRSRTFFLRKILFEIIGKALHIIAIQNIGLRILNIAIGIVARNTIILI